MSDEASARMELAERIIKAVREGKNTSALLFAEVGDTPDVKVALFDLIYAEQLILDEQRVLHLPAPDPEPEWTLDAIKQRYAAVMDDQDPPLMGIDTMHYNAKAWQAFLTCARKDIGLLLMIIDDAQFVDAAGIMCEFDERIDTAADAECPGCAYDWGCENGAIPPDLLIIPQHVETCRVGNVQTVKPSHS